jgi:hypothetical protein
MDAGGSVSSGGFTAGAFHCTIEGCVAGIAPPRLSSRSTLWAYSEVF